MLAIARKSILFEFEDEFWVVERSSDLDRRSGVEI
jgi:hypothetical protein